MRVRANVFFGDTSYFDTTFLERRDYWLPYTGVYLEFVVKGINNKNLDFRVTSSDGEAISISRHSWNRFFLNIQGSGSISFELLEGEKVKVAKQVSFEVVSAEVPLLYSLLFLFKFPVADIRFFANRLSENLVNSTRFILFTPKCTESLVSSRFTLESPLWRLYELIFSILTERGITVYVTPFHFQGVYSLDLVKKLKETLLGFMDRSKKFRIVWDFSSGLREKELGGLVDSVVSRFERDIPLMVSSQMYNRLGGEGFCHGVESFGLEEAIPLNEKGVKIARLKGERAPDFYTLRVFSQKAREAGWGTECVYPFSGKSLRLVPYSLSRALYRGYCDAHERSE